MVRDWKERSGWLIDEPEQAEPELIIKYSEFRRYCEDKKFTGLKNTYEEMIISLCKDYNLKLEEAKDMKLSDVIIFSLMKEKEAFENWWAINQGS